MFTRFDDWFIDNFWQDLADWVTDKTFCDCYQWAEALIIVEVLFEFVELIFIQDEMTTGHITWLFVWAAILVPLLICVYRTESKRPEGTLPETRINFSFTRIFLSFMTVVWAIILLIEPSPGVSVICIQHILLVSSIYLGSCSRKTPEKELQLEPCHDHS